MEKSNHHLSFGKMQHLKNLSLIMFNSYPHCKRQTYLSASFVKCAHLQSLYGIVFTSACKSETLGYQEDNIIM